MRGNWFAVTAASVLAICGALNAAKAQEPEWELPDVPEIYEFDSSWPKPLPNDATIGTVTGLFVDHEDHIWVMHRPYEGDVSVIQDTILEFDAEGNLLNSWGTADSAPEGLWPAAPHTVFVDRESNVWVGGAGPGDGLLKFSADGEFISDLGNRGPVVERRGMIQDNQTNLLRVGTAGAAFDDAEREVYIADGYLNRRIMVFDADTGEFKRGWGAYGKALSEISNEPQPGHDPNNLHAEDFTAPVHCVRISNDGLVYVCDRAGDRIQVFTKAGEFVKEFHVAHNTMGNGTVGSIDFSADPEQQ